MRLSACYLPSLHRFAICKQGREVLLTTREVKALMKDLIESAVQSRISLFSPSEVSQYIQLLLEASEDDPRLEMLKKKIKEQVEIYLQGGTEGGRV